MPEQRVSYTGERVVSLLLQRNTPARGMLRCSCPASVKAQRGLPPSSSLIFLRDHAVQEIVRVGLQRAALEVGAVRSSSRGCVRWGHVAAGQSALGCRVDRDSARVNTQGDSVSKVEMDCDCCHTGPRLHSLHQEGMAHDVHRGPLPALSK